MGNCGLSKMGDDELRELFDSIDLDKNNEIDKEELGHALNRFGLPAGPVPSFILLNILIYHHFRKTLIELCPWLT